MSYFSLAAGRPSRHMDPFVITVDPSGEADHELVGHEGEEWLYGMEGCIEIEYGKELYVLHPGESIYYELHRASSGAMPMTARRRSSWPSCTRRSRGGNMTTEAITAPVPGDPD